MPTFLEVAEALLVALDAELPTAAEDEPPEEVMLAVEVPVETALVVEALDTEAVARIFVSVTFNTTLDTCAHQIRYSARM